MGCGADELIDLLMRCVLDDGDCIVDCPPTFTMYLFDAAVNNARAVTVPRLEGFKIDVEGEPRSRLALPAGRGLLRGPVHSSALLQNLPQPSMCREYQSPPGGMPSTPLLTRTHTPAPSSTHHPLPLPAAGIKRAVAEHRPKIVFLTSPNNPDGSMLSTEELLEVLALPVLVVLDEAYIEFSEEPSKMGWVARYPNLVVLRTFSKCAALAGLRCARVGGRVGGGGWVRLPCVPL